MYGNLLIVSSVMEIEYEIVCVWETVTKAILLLNIHMFSVCISELGRRLHIIKKFVYIILCTVLRVCNNWGSCAARSLPIYALMCC